MRLLLLSLILTTLPACDPTEPGTAEVVEQDSVTSLAADSLLPAFADTTTAILQPDSISCSFTYITSWCNGYAPSEEDVAELNTPRRLYNMPLRLKNSAGSFDLQTDKKGRYKGVIPPGLYTIYLVSNSDYTKSPLHPSCDEYYGYSFGEVDIEEGMVSLGAQVKFPCDLCDDSMKKRP